ncbi:MAG: hypothetical protein F9K32_12000 [Desulfobulbaceae bacterium]|nr:MAG: hypothetical protein F9K32_12000 [Desulfobulbaceae bacterium]
MPTIHFEEIQCYNPRGIRDDVRLSAACDGHDRRTIWGPEQMRERSEIDLTSRCDPVVYYDTASIRLSGDFGFNFGSMHFDRHSDPGGNEFFFPGDLNSRYRVAYRIDPQPVASTHGRIRLIRLDCNDAQGTHDEISLRVNGAYVLNRHVMRTGWYVNFDDDRYEFPFNSACTITLSESYLEDWGRSFTLRVGEYRVARYEHEFALDAGISGDARYTLAYRMLE